ncbi:MAG: hypothetical protein R6V49_06755 [Bacteroidales bacterium]
MYRKTVLLMTLMMSFLIVYGQGEGHHEDVVVVKPYNPMVDDAFKINISPVITDTVVSRTPLTYEITPMKLSTDIEIAPIKAARMSGMPQPELYRLFLKTGFGNYTTPYFEVFYNSVRSRRGAYGIHYKHLSSMGKIPEYAYQGFSDNSFDAFATLFGKNHIFDFKGAYGRDVVHFYGRQDSLVNDTLDRETIRQRFHTASFDVGMKSNFYRGDNLNHRLGLQYKMINDAYETTEHAAKFQGDLDKLVTWFNFSRTQTIGLNTSAEFYSTQMAEDTTTNTFDQLLVRINPYMQARIKDLDLRAGATAGYMSENNGTLKLFPDISLKISLKEHKFILMGGLDGGMERSSFYALTAINPYTISDPEMRNTITKIRVYGGLRTAIGPRVTLTARVSNESVANMALYTADTSLLFQNRFKVLYDDGTILSLKAELSYQAAEKLRISGKVLYQDYNMNTELYAWHKPAFTGGLDVRYNLDDKILAYAELNYLADIRVKTYINNVEEDALLKNILDINFGAEYRYSSLLSGFLRINNLAASKYNRWQHYPAQRFNMMLGITYAL